MGAGTRVGVGYDAHRLVAGRRLVLGGVTIPHERGLLGHSDADVAIHATIDALLGAAALGDIGQHFPPSDPAYKDADSRRLLALARELLERQGWRPVNVDCTIVAEAPNCSTWLRLNCPLRPRKRTSSPSACFVRQWPQARVRGNCSSSSPAAPNA